MTKSIWICNFFENSFEFGILEKIHLLEKLLRILDKISIINNKIK
jgi:hypothetical protein